MAHSVSRNEGPCRQARHTLLPVMPMVPMKLTVCSLLAAMVKPSASNSDEHDAFVPQYQ